ncbi:hypothetical protein K438DRAFT_1761570 [Mycena galopus ATCC 62051]|nr:hypothetical protein K438DRAFT_1761570 [Mycena galopus ATCC 62051]
MTSTNTDSDSSDDDTHANEVDDSTNIKRAGHRFVMNWGLWVKGNAHIFEEPLDPAYDEKQRFEMTANKIQGQLRDIEKVLPDGYRGRKTKHGQKWVARAEWKWGGASETTSRTNMEGMEWRTE